MQLTATPITRAQTRDEALLEGLREQLHAPDLEWAEPLRTRGEGAESIVLDLSLRNAGEWSGAPLVVRLLQTDAPDQLAREAAVQAAVAEAGFPAPRPVAHGPGRPNILQPFLVMDRVPGRVMFSLLPVVVVAWIALGAVGVGWLGWVLGVGWYLLAVLLQRRLHALPVEAIERVIAERGLDPAELRVAAWVERLGAQLERLELDGPGRA